MKGWKTIVFFVLTAALAGVDAISEMIDLPLWYYTYVVPIVGVILRYLTTSAIFKK